MHVLFIFHMFIIFQEMHMGFDRSMEKRYCVGVALAALSASIAIAFNGYFILVCRGVERFE